MVENATIVPPTCANCQREPKTYFEIRHYRDGTPSPKTVCVCSIVCLMRWAYSYGMQKGIAGVVNLQMLIETLKGKKVP
jgi:hypothetical protein